MLARPNGREPSDDELRPTLHPSDADRSAVDALLSSSGVKAGDSILALAPGSVWGTKRWPYYPELAKQLSSATTRIVIVGGADDAELARAIVAVVPNAIDATGKLSLLASADLIGRAAVLVTNDSLPQHLASAMATPTVSIFGPTVPEFGFGPLAPRAVVLGHTGLTCRPCDRHGPQTCPLGHFKCMRELEPAGVVEQVRSLVSLGNVDA
jgi:heptosyltransferase-2